MATSSTDTQPASGKEQFLEVYEQEHERTMRVLRAYPPDKAELRPHPKLKTARELAFMFALERGLGTAVFNDAFASGGPSGKMPDAPASWDAVLEAVEKSHKEFGELVRSTPDEKLQQTAKFFVGPKKMGDIPRLDFAWFLLHDEIHHRGQFSVYLRMADANVPSIYGPSADEPWF